MWISSSAGAMPRGWGARTVSYTIAVIAIVGIVCSGGTAGEALQFQYLAAGRGNRSEFRVVVPDDPLYNGTHATYDENGVVWLTPEPGAPEELANLSRSFNVGRFIYGDRVPVLSASPTSGRPAVSSFSTSFEFRIVTSGSYGESGDGMAFFMAAEPSIPVNSTGALLGLASGAGSFTEQAARHLFAVEFDTNRNPDVDDPNASHVGIDINSLASEASTDDAAALPSSPLYLYRNSSFLAWVTYNSSTHLIAVFVTNDTSSPPRKPLSPSLLYQIDLSSIFNNEFMYVGFSASTGRALYQSHALYSWNFSIESPASPGNSTRSFSDSPLSPAAPPLSDTIQRNCNPFYSCHHAKLVLPLVLGFSTTAAVCTFLVLYYKRRRSIQKAHYAFSSNKLRSQSSMIDSSVHRYRYAQIKKATKGFHDRNFLGQGAFSRVYKGSLPVNGVLTTVAVKKLNEGLGEEDAFPSEIKIISAIRHRNLLQLHGWCYHKGKALLVYQYMRHGSLDQHLYGRKSNMGLGSEKRFNILLGVAAALEYLHEGLGECVLHRDVKAANVLLNEDMEPLLGDFGLARLISHDKIVTMTAAGTPGYLAPEVFFTGKATEKADVYSFGVLALEVACGRKVLEYNLQPQEMNLIEWAWLLQKSHKLLDALDPKLTSSASTSIVSTNAKGEDSHMLLTLMRNGHNQGRNDVNDLWRCVLHLGLICSHPLPNSRPTMRQVHNVLKDGVLLPLPPMRPDFPYSISLPMTSQSIRSGSSMRSNGTMSFSVRALGRSPSSASSNLSFRLG